MKFSLYNLQIRVNHDIIMRCEISSQNVFPLCLCFLKEINGDEILEENYLLWSFACNLPQNALIIDSILIEDQYISIDYSFLLC